MWTAFCATLLVALDLLVGWLLDCFCTWFCSGELSFEFPWKVGINVGAKLFVICAVWLGLLGVCCNWLWWVYDLRWFV